MFGGGLESFDAPDTNDWVLLLSADHSTPPVIYSNPDTHAVQGEIYSYQVQASGEPEPLFRLQQAPPSMTVEPGTGLIEWLPSSSGEFQVEILAENKAGSDTQQFSLEVYPQPVEEDIIYFPLISKRSGISSH